MTASTKKSVNVTQIETAPLTELAKKAKSKKVLIDTVEAGTANVDEIGDIILFGPVPSNAVITSIKIFNDDLDSHSTPTLAADVGLYYSGKGSQSGLGKVSGDVVDADCFATAITSLQAAVVLGSEVRFEVANIDGLGKEAWDIGGLSVDPGSDFYVGLTMTAAAATAAAGTISVQIEYLA